MVVKDKVQSSIATSNYISRDLSWMAFNYRVLDQSRKPSRNLFEKLKFLAITSSNLDEFFMIRVGSLYNYLDYGKERIDYSGLRERPFRKKLLKEAQDFFREQSEHYIHNLLPAFKKQHFRIVKNMDELQANEKKKISDYFNRTIYPMLTPMVYDSYHAFPTLMNRLLVFGVVTRNPQEKKDQKKLSFVQIPQNLPRFYEVDREDELLLVPIEETIRAHMELLFRNIDIVSVNLFRITRNGDFTLEESDDIEANFVEEVRRKLKTRKTGRVVRVEVEQGYSHWMMRLLVNRWSIDRDNIFEVPHNCMLDYTALFELINNSEFKNKIPSTHQPVPADHPAGNRLGGYF